MNSELLDPVLLQTDFPDLQLHASGKVRDVYQLDDGTAAVRGHGPHFGLRLCAGNRDSAQRPGADPDVAILVRISIGHCPQPSNHCGRSSLSEAFAEVWRSVARAFDGGAAGADVSGGMRSARLHFGISVEGIQGDGQSVRHRIADRTARVGCTPGADFHAVDQGHKRP